MSKPDYIPEEEWNDILIDGQYSSMSFFVEAIIDFIKNLDQPTEERIATIHLTLNYVIPSMLNDSGKEMYKTVLDEMTTGMECRKNSEQESDFTSLIVPDGSTIN